MCTDNQKDVLLYNLVNTGSSCKKFNYQKMSLQARGNFRKFVSSFLYKKLNYIKRASLRLSVGIRASVSIEAAIAIPVFLFCFLEILSLLNYISVYSGVLYSMKAAGDPVCIYGYVSDLLTDDTEEVQIGEKVVTALIFSELYLDTQIRKQCADPIYENTIQNGTKGISLLGSYVDREDSDISIVARYTMKPVISFAGTELSVICRYYGRLWTGYSVEGNEVDEDYVYITENGSVYHLTESCTYLKLSISSVARSDLSQKRNSSGRKYKACELCCEDKGTKEIYYITDSGTKYHAELDCSGLKRTVYRVEKSEVEGWSACSRCGKEE